MDDQDRSNGMSELADAHHPPPGIPLLDLDGADSDWLRLVMDSLSEGFSLLAPDFTLLAVNREAIRIDGRSREELIGQSHWVAYPETEHSELGELYRKAMSARVPVALEHLYKWPDGRASWFEMRAFPVENGCLAVLYQDVTERHTTEERVRQIERRVRSAVSVVEGVLWTNNPQGEMEGEQPGWASLTGQTKEQYSGYGWADAVHPDDAQPTIDAWRAAVAAMAPFEFEHRVKRHDGQWRLCAIRANYVEGPDGAIVEWVGVHRDITDLRHAQQLLERNAETFTKLLVENPFGIYVVNADFKMAEVSWGARRIFENVNPLIGRDFAEVLRILWSDPFASEAIGRFRHTFATGEPYVSLSTVERRADIDEVEAYDWRIERLTLPDGRYGVVCYFYDLSERNAYEAKLTQAIADKDLLAREIDHRVKNNLAVVGSLLSMQRSTATSEETRLALEDAAHRVMAVARVHERLHKSDHLGVVAFGEYLEELCHDMASSMQSDDVQLDCDAVSIDLPAEAALSLALIANELVTNAFKHGRAAGATVISVGLARSAKSLTLSVSDNGAGIPASLASTAGSLGLKVVDGLARRLDAKLSIPSPGAPAQFSVTIPESRIHVDRAG